MPSASMRRVAVRCGSLWMRGGHAKCASIETDKCNVASQIPTSVDLMGVLGVSKHVHMCGGCAKVNMHGDGCFCASGGAR